MQTEDYIFGLHPVIEAIEAGREIDKILVKKDLHSETAIRLHDLAHKASIPLQRVPVEKLNRITRKNHQGVVALLSAVSYQRLDLLVPALYEDGVTPLILILDGITDVRNFGGIARTAECCGVNAIVVPDRGSVTVGADAVRTSAGALNYIPVCRERSLVDAVQLLLQSGYRVVAATEKSTINYTETSYTEPTAIVMGAEGTGITPRILQLCTDRVAIPMFGHIGSLNVGVAAGVMLYEAVRQRLDANLEVL